MKNKFKTRRMYLQTKFQKRPAIQNMCIYAYTFNTIIEKYTLQLENGPQIKADISLNRIYIRQINTEKDAVSLPIREM